MDAVGPVISVVCPGIEAVDPLAGGKIIAPTLVHEVPGIGRKGGRKAPAGVEKARHHVLGVSLETFDICHIDARTAGNICLAIQEGYVVIVGIGKLRNVPEGIGPVPETEAVAGHGVDIIPVHRQFQNNI